LGGMVEGGWGGPWPKGRRPSMWEVVRKRSDLANSEGGLIRSHLAYNMEKTLKKNQDHT